MRKAATKICGEWKRDVSKKHDKWWIDKVKDTVEKKKLVRIIRPQINLLKKGKNLF